MGLKKIERKEEIKRYKGNRKQDGMPVKKRKNREILVITYFFVGVFLLMLGYMAYYLMIESSDAINNSYNKRQDLLAERVVRGKILSKDREVLAETVTENDGKEIRYYPYKGMFSHIVGHFSQGRTGIELLENYKMLQSNDNPIGNLSKELAGKKTLGDNVVTTLSVNLQKIAYQTLGNRKGAVVAIEPSTGKILAMVSKPDYDPNPEALNNNWNYLLQDPNQDSTLLNRATQGLYPPGSIFKILTVSEYMRESDKNSYHYQCSGKLNYKGVDIHCYGNKIHGLLDLKHSFSKSCNSSFAHIGSLLDIGRYRGLCEDFLFNREIPVQFPYKKSSFVLSSKSDDEEVLHTAMGQGKTVITPLHAAMIVSAIGNQGKMMTPFVVDRLESSEGILVEKTKESVCATPVSKEEATTLKDYMEEVINGGTATALKGLGYKVAGKTGSAEFNNSKDSHSWFVGFAPADNPKIAISVIVEGAGTGSEYAVPMAKQIFQVYLSQ